MSGLLEVIAFDAADAEAAQAGGADRVELCRDLAADGLTPELPVVRSVLAATDLPVRVMVREQTGFGADVDLLRRRVGELLDAGAREFVLGFLDEHGQVDLDATRAVVAELAGRPWTFHRAVDHAAQYRTAWARAVSLGPDTVLTAGGPSGVAEGLSHLRELAAVQDADGVELLVGGGLRQEHVPVLREAGVRAFHIGSGARSSGPVLAELVRSWRELLDS
ncbi:copper homeostasis protein [Saccharopolyspora antimicrobica]|uniref:Copper homeostasis protein cutC homolog n=1 Tax=Saccharopolyspora antimicrobica TaxID=455193 RepID=A0A1I5IYM6_9PSEU|nr:copper homeostasis protein CutC [Saccharopolyspora antimicrobica]RKT83794.1 copper homeostasis protein [Saccharopolyspora antimicrobica]SFO65618.1 copper homeostasis protein [Saccharopolyspora antimicrobica]